jgi:hypothetical protein
MGFKFVKGQKFIQIVLLLIKIKKARHQTKSGKKNFSVHTHAQTRCDGDGVFPIQLDGITMHFRTHNIAEQIAVKNVV